MKAYRFFNNITGESFTEEFANEQDARDWCEDKPFSYIGVAYRLGWNTDAQGNRLYEEDVR